MLTLRAATTDDVEAVLSFWRAAAEESDRPGDSADDVRRLISRDAEALLLAVDGSTIVGSVIAGWDGWRCHVYRLAVHPDHRRLGVSTLLLDHTERRFADVGGKRVDAMVLDDNELGQTVWRSRGYARQHRWSRWVKTLR